MAEVNEQLNGRVALEVNFSTGIPQAIPMKGLILQDVHVSPIDPTHDVSGRTTDTIGFGVTETDICAIPSFSINHARELAKLPVEKRADYLREQGLTQRAIRPDEISNFQEVVTNSITLALPRQPSVSAAQLADVTVLPPS
ncbi:hypothetical protein MUP32_01105 [Candidatus Microgenomates bacterium]|nr:hypothetical protein [Candidatus Microgenomates bacterium]